MSGGREINPRRIAVIGFGEVGKTFARGFIASGRHDVATFDILFDNSAAGAALREAARTMAVEAAPSFAAAVAGARVVISAVTAASAYDVAREAGRHLGPGQFFLDINSVAPETKRADATAVAPSGATYVEAAVMAPVAPYGLAVPMFLGGKRAAELAAILVPAGMKMQPVAEEIGEASAIKMCRSVMIKGIEALAVECFLTARRYGVEDRIVASLNETFKPLDWEKLAGYLIERVVQHGRRRAAEMREAAETVAAAGLDPLMTRATALRQDWVADQVAAAPALKAIAEAEWRKTMDTLLARLGKKEKGEAAE
jgi:3-hydroxyisobutyrate dehydrogenase-like beta-hydroxyacid dehydrogenase